MSATRWHDTGTTNPLAVTVGTVSGMTNGVNTVRACAINFSDLAGLDDGQNTFAFFFQDAQYSPLCSATGGTTGRLHFKEIKERETLTPQPYLVPSLAEKVGLDIQRKV